MIKKQILSSAQEELSERKSDWSLHWSEKLAKGEMLQPVQLGKHMNRGNIMVQFPFFYTAA